uniref:Uncharacterized protein n=1 Tax=Anopheles stephensi TaxID=30069 RepID=A0A182Y3R2_ANOST
METIWFGESDGKTQIEQLMALNDLSDDDEDSNIPNNTDAAENEKKDQQKPILENSGHEVNNTEDRPVREEFVSDFDTIRERKQAERSRSLKRKKDRDSIENDDLIEELLQRMRQAASQDRLLNVAGKPATKKIAILHQVMPQLIKKDLQHDLLCHNVLCVLTDWIAPLPNRALPCLQIREGVLKLLLNFPTIDKCYLKQSGIGKAVMYLYKHPDETKVNRDRAHVLITGWFRSVYNISTSFNGMSLEERRQHDLQHLSSACSKPPVAVVVQSTPPVCQPDFWLFTPKKDIIRPGDKGWSYRARVPRQSDKVYIVRPKPKIEVNIGTYRSKKQLNRYELCWKRFNESKRQSKARPLVDLSIEGAKLRDN